MKIWVPSSYNELFLGTPQLWSIPISFLSFTLSSIRLYYSQRLGVNFTNVFTRRFYARRSPKRKKLLDLTVFFALL